MAISFVAGSAPNGVNSNAPSITLSASILAGDFLIITITQRQDTSSTSQYNTPAGWTKQFESYGFAVYTKIAVAGDIGATVNFTSSVTAFWMVATVAYRGVDNSNPLDGGIFSCPTLKLGGTSFTRAFHLPDAIPTFANDWAVSLYGVTDQSGTNLPPTPTGFTSRASSSFGPSALIADKTLTTGARQGGIDTTPVALGQGGNFESAILLLKASGAATTTPDPDQPTLVGAILAASSSTNGRPIDFGGLNPKTGDLVVIGFSGHSQAVTPPSGYSTVRSAGNTQIMTHTWTNGDSTNVTVGMANTDFNAGILCLFRRVGSASTSSPSIDASAVLATTGTAFSTSSISPGGTVDYFLAMWIDEGDAVETWTNPGTLATDMSDGGGPSVLMAWERLAASGATGTFSASVTTSTTMGAYALALQIVAGGTPGVGQPWFKFHEWSQRHWESGD